MAKKPRVLPGYSIALLAPVALCALLAPISALAQSHQVIVMACDQPPPFTKPWIITLDLTARTETDELWMPSTPPSVSRFSSPITEITDQSVTWVAHFNPEHAVTEVLDRYSGTLTSRFDDGTSESHSCHRQDKQF